LYSTFLLWLPAELYEQLPEVGDLDRPKLVFFDTRPAAPADMTTVTITAAGGALSMAEKLAARAVSTAGRELVRGILGSLLR